MNRKIALVIAGGSAVVGLVGSAHGASSTLDGSLDTAYGVPLSVQTQVTNTPFELTTPGNARSTPQTVSQLSAAYGFVDTTNNKLDLFLSGSMNLGANTTSTALVLAIQTNATGVQSLAGQTELPLSGTNVPPLDNVVFDAGFKPQSLFTFQFNAGIASDYYNLTTATHVAADLTNPTNTAAMSKVGGANGPSDSFNSSHTYGYDDPTGVPGSGNPQTGAGFGGARTRTDTGAPTYSIEVNNTLDTVAVGSGAAASTARGGSPADPGFTGATTGAEYQFNLTSDPLDTTGLYYTGGPINIEAFLTNNSFGSITNQVLGAASATTPDQTPSTIPQNVFQQPFSPGFQFLDPTVYAGNQFFTVPGTPVIAIPEPASLSLIAVAGGTLLGWRRRRA